MNQKRTIIGACDYTIESMKNLKKSMMDFGANEQEVSFAIGGIISTLTSNLIQICDKVFIEAAQSGNPNAEFDLLEIKRLFNNFIDRMINLD